VYNPFKQLLWGYLLLLLITLDISVYGFDIIVTNDPLSSPNGRYLLTLEMQIDQIFPESIEILVDLGSTNRDCSYFSQDVLSSGFVTGCEIYNERIKLSTNTKEALQIKLTFKQVEYGSSISPKPLYVMITSQSLLITLTGTNLKDWVPQQVVKFSDFVIIPDRNILTCQPFNLIVSGTLYTTIIGGFKLELIFDSDLDTSNCTSENLLDLQKSSRVVSGITNQEYSSSDFFAVQFKGIKGPSFSGNLTATITISTDSFEVHKATRKFLVSPEIFSVTGVIRLLDNKAICTKGRYALEISSRCATIPNPVYEIIAPFKGFGDQHVKISSNEDLTGTTIIEFELTNPCLVIPETALITEEFSINVYNGNTNDVAFTLKSGLTTGTSYEPGLIKNFEVEPESRATNVECPYTFKMRNSRLIPKDGKIILTVNPFTSFKEDLETTMNGVKAEMSHNEGVFTVKVPMHISSLTDIEITIGNFKNPPKDSRGDDIEVGFIANSFNPKNYKIDESESVVVLIDAPEVASMIYTMPNNINFAQSTYFFTLTPRNTKINTDDILGIKIPSEIDISTCYIGHEEVTGIKGEDFDFWISARNIILNSSNSLSFSANCRNPATTAPTSNLKVAVFNSEGKKKIIGETSLQTKRGSSFSSRTSSIKCDKTCPRCKAMCTIILRRINTARFRTIDIYSPILDLEELTCLYDESGQSFLSTCTKFKKGSEEHIKVTLSVSRAVSTIVVSNIGIIYPEYRSTSASFFITTYTSEDIDSNAIIESDTPITFKGSCNYPCKSCSEDNPNFCYTCTEDLVDGKRHYLYPEGAQSCSVSPNLNCRLLEANLCCTGYYRDEASHQCLSCDYGCGSCEETKPYCRGCSDPELYLSNGKCKETCDEGSYPSPFSRYCVTCSEGCKTCTSDTECSECYTGYYFYEDKQECVKECPSGTYLERTMCKPCESDCGSCYESSTKCTGCNIGKYLLYDKCVDKGTCKRMGYIANDSINACEPCSSLCVECQESATFCSKCKENEFLNMVEGTCLTTCVPHGYNVLGTDGTHGTCAPCENNCKLCISATECLTCISDYLFHTATKECVSSCSDGYYGHEKKCYPCNSFCESCDSLSTCFRCPSGYILYKGQCYQGNCPEGTFDSNSICEECDSSCATCSGNKYSCTKCTPNRYKHGDRCVSTCPAKTVLIGSSCESCNSSCHTCEGTKDSCTSCQEDKYLYKGECLNACPISTTIDITLSNICVDCVVGCKECIWDNVNDLYPKLCINCLPGYKFLDSNCYMVCPDGYVSNSDDSLCIDFATARDEEMLSSKSKYIIFPHIFVAAFLSVVLIKFTNNEHSFVNANLMIILNFVAISTYISTIGTASSEYKTELILVTGGVLVLQVILNLLFVIIFMKLILDDSDFNTWKDSHCNARYFVFIISALFSLQNIRLLYSKFLGLDIFSMKLKNLDNFFKFLNWYSLLQLILVQGVIIIFDAVQLIRLPYRTMNYTFVIESFIISSLLVLSLYYEIKISEVLSSVFKQEIMNEWRNNPLILSQSLSGESIIDGKSPTTKQIIENPRDCDCEEKKRPDQQCTIKAIPGGKYCGSIPYIEEGNNNNQVYSRDLSKEQSVKFRNNILNPTFDSNLNSLTPAGQEQFKAMELSRVVQQVSHGQEGNVIDRFGPQRSSAAVNTMNKRRSNEDNDSSQKYVKKKKNNWDKLSIIAIESNEVSDQQPINLVISENEVHNSHPNLDRKVLEVNKKKSPGDKV